MITVPVEEDKATGVYEDFLTGFVLPGGKVWGRPVGVVVAKDGSLLVSDDGSNSIWRVTYTGGKSSVGRPVILDRGRSWRRYVTLGAAEALRAPAIGVASAGNDAVSRRMPRRYSS